MSELQSQLFHRAMMGDTTWADSLRGLPMATAGSALAAVLTRLAHYDPAHPKYEPS